MKLRLLPLIAATIAATSTITSCLDNDVEEVVYDPNSSITGFSIGTLNIDRMGKDRNGADSPYVDTLDCSMYPFTINQMTRTIENKDSLPIGIHVDKVVTNITYDSNYGILAYRPKGAANDTVWSSTDSIDFTEPVEFKVYLYSGSTGSPYTVKVNVHQIEPDTMAWADFDAPAEEQLNLSLQTSLFADGRIYTFGEDGTGNPVVRYNEISDNGTPNGWETLTFDTPLDIRPYSPVLWKENIYFLCKNTADEYCTLYYMNPADGNAEPTSPPCSNVLQLIATDGNRLYASTEDGLGFFDENLSWTKDTEEAEFAVDGRISAYSEPLSYNANITRTVILGHNQVEKDTAAVVYQRLSNESGWTKLTQNQSMPNLKNISMIHYDDKLCAFGGPSSSSTSIVTRPFKSFYSSDDNGLTWWPVTECMYFPETFKEVYTEEEGSYSATVDSDNFIWIVWNNGNLSRGRINRLGFDPKW